MFLHGPDCDTVHQSFEISCPFTVQVQALLDLMSCSFTVQVQAQLDLLWKFDEDQGLQKRFPALA